VQASCTDRHHGPLLKIGSNIRSVGRRTLWEKAMSQSNISCACFVGRIQVFLALKT
jgi:hypothetical protein